MSGIVDAIGSALTGVSQNRTRAAVVVASGYSALDTYKQWQPVLFALSLVGVAWSGALLAKRHKKSAETIALYASTGLASIVAAYVTRPDSLRPATTPGADPTTDRVLTWLDARARALDTQSPDWQEATWSRLSNDVRG